jgi:phage baseplate assembly protein W
VAISTRYFDPAQAMWPPDLRRPLVPVRIGMDATTGKVLIGWDHVCMSIARILACPFHSRPMRRWVGSFVPHILGKEAVPTIILRFFWAIASAIDLNEPCYRIKQTHFMGFALDEEGVATVEFSAEELRLGHAVFRTEGVFLPRGHLGDFTPETRRQIGLVGKGLEQWDAVPVSDGTSVTTGGYFG